MNEKGIISYYNLFVVLFLSLSIALSLIYNISVYRNETYYYELLTVIQNDENNLYRLLHDIAQENKVPKYYYDEDGNRLEIEVVDNINFIYKVTKQNDNALKSSMGIIDVYVYINNKEFKIIKWEYRKSEQI